MTFATTDIDPIYWGNLAAWVSIFLSGAVLAFAGSEGYRRARERRNTRHAVLASLLQEIRDLKGLLHLPAFLDAEYPPPLELVLYVDACRYLYLMGDDLRPLLVDIGTWIRWANVNTRSSLYRDLCEELVVKLESIDDPLTMYIFGRTSR